MPNVRPSQMSAVDEVLVEWLPSRAARWVAAGTLALAAASFGLPEFFEKLEVPLARDAKLLIRVSAPLALALIGTLLVLALVLWYLHSAPRVASRNGDSEISFDRADPLASILALIAKYHSQEIPATPRRIAADLAMDPDVTLAFMWKYHNEQLFTFRNDGKRPELDTAFFLSPKAWDVIKIVKA